MAKHMFLAVFRNSDDEEGTSYLGVCEEAQDAGDLCRKDMKKKAKEGEFNVDDFEVVKKNTSWQYEDTLFYNVVKVPVKP